MNTIENNNYCVILAGGKGRRLWPNSRENFPKQFMDFFGTGRTQLQSTFDRFSKIVPPDHIFISTNQVYAHYVESQLPELPHDNILVEPIHRNTAPSAAWACYRISHLCRKANLIITPSDQTVINEEAFRENVMKGFEFVSSHEGLLAMGVKPTRPEPGYGYIQLGNETDIPGLYQIKSFTEKPERQFAIIFMESGEFLWNTGIVLSNVQHMINSLKEVLPSVMREIDFEGAALTIEEEQEYVRNNFPTYPNLSIDYGLLEKVRNVYTLKCDFGWADLGTWHSIYEAMSKNEGDNVVIDSDVFLENSHNNIIKLPEGRTAVIDGLDGYIVAEKDNVLFICKKEDSSALVRKYVSEIQIKRGDDYV